MTERTKEPWLLDRDILRLIMWHRFKEMMIEDESEYDPNQHPLQIVENVEMRMDHTGENKLTTVYRKETRAENKAKYYCRLNQIYNSAFKNWKKDMSPLLISCGCHDCRKLLE